MSACPYLCLTSAVLLACAGGPLAALDQPVVRALSQTPFERAWDVPLGAPMQIGFWNRALPESVYLQVQGANAIYAIDAMTGLTRWVSQPLPEAIKLSVPPNASRFEYRGEAAGILTEDRLWVVSQERLFSLDDGSGHAVWTYQLPYSPSTGFVAQGRGESLRVTSGNWEGRIETLTFQEARNNPYRLWQWNIQAAVTAMPVYSQGIVYTADHQGVVHAFKPDREMLWEKKVGGAILAPVLVNDKILYVGNEDNVVLALNRLSGETLGQINVTGQIRRAPFSFSGEPDRVYVWVSNENNPAHRGLQALKVQPDRVPFVEGHGRSPTLPTDRSPAPLDVVRMDLAWFVPGLTELVASTPEHLLVQREGDHLIHALNRRKGTIDWSWNPGEDHRDGNKHGVNPATIQVIPYQDPNDQVRTIFTVDPKGMVIAYRLQGYRPPEVRRIMDERAAEMLRDRNKEKAAEKAPEKAAEKPAEKPAAEVAPQP